MHEVEGPYSFSNLINLAEMRLDNEAWHIRMKGSGSLVNIVTSDSDSVAETYLIRGFAEKIGINPDLIEHFDIGSLISAFELNIDTSRFEIPEDHLDTQSPAENIFEYIYKGFGKDGGWRIGLSAIADRLGTHRQKLQIAQEMLNTPFGNFIGSLSLDLESDSTSPRLLVLDFPSIEDLIEVRDARDVDWSTLLESKKLQIAKILTVFSAINNPFPSRFTDDNPQGNVVINLIDPLYKWFLRNDEFLKDYESLSSAVVLPNAHDRDLQILYS